MNTGILYGLDPKVLAGKWLPAELEFLSERLPWPMESADVFLQA
jgi:hypothetical protein